MTGEHILGLILLDPMNGFAAANKQPLKGALYNDVFKLTLSLFRRNGEVSASELYEAMRKTYPQFSAVQLCEWMDVARSPENDPVEEEVPF